MILLPVQPVSSSSS